MAAVFLKDKIKKLLWTMRLRETLPASAINKIEIKENNEPLVDIKEDTALFLSESLQAQPNVYLCQSVYARLKKAQALLPENYFLKICSAFRSLKEQEYRWAQKLGQNRREHPNMSAPELERLTKSQVADPRTGFGGHQTGGAVDVTLCRSDGTEYDMGTGYSALSPEIKTSSKKILLTQRKNREILKMCMEKAGFINYPNEWWHYCYGDRMWAAYSKRKTCFYGLPEKER